MTKKILIISAHPDDETLGAGGTLLKHREQGDEIYWLIITSVFESQGFSSQIVQNRKSEINHVKEVYGFKQIFCLDYPTMTISSETIVGMVPRISEIFQKVQPQTIYTLNRSDAHSDHRHISDAVMACTKSFRYPFIERVLMYECISETEFAPQFPEKVFIPNYFVDVTKQLKQKLEIMSIFASEVGEHPFPRSLRNIEALAVHRGAIAGCEYAEAFQVVKIIEK